MSAEMSWHCEELVKERREDEEEDGVVVEVVAAELVVLRLLEPMIISVP